MPVVNFEDVLRCLELERCGEQRYRAPHIAMPYRRIFGGQLLAQSIAVAHAVGSSEAVAKSVKSLHTLFLREGDLDEAVEYRVERLREGRTFSALSITALQSRGAILNASVQLHAAEDGAQDEHQVEMPELDPPERSAPVDLSMLPWEVRAVEGADLESRKVGPARYDFWMRAPAVDGELAIHQALLAHATDLTVIGTTLRPLPGLAETDSPERLATAVTTHTLWFHRPFRIDAWCLVTQTSPSLAGARGFGWGHVFAETGALVASFAQESMIRRVSAAGLPGQADE